MKILGIITTILTLAYLFYNRQLALLLNLSNIFFILGFLYLFIAFLLSIKNVGFFKIHSYNKYRNKEAKIQNEKEEKLTSEEELNQDNNKDDLLDFREFSDESYENDSSNKDFIIFGLTLIILSFILAFLAK